jgi:uncharacterized protein (DUF1697 family)
MASHAAFLRGVNLGRNRRVGGAELRAIFEGLGLEGVATFRTSGNVVFDAKRKPGAARIERELEAALGYEVRVFLRSAGEVRAIADEQPFASGVVEASAGKLQVALLPSKPAAGTRRRALELATDEDRLAFGDRELYWLPSGGTRDSALDMKAIERLVGPNTMRTKGTLEQLATKYFPG